MTVYPKAEVYDLLLTTTTAVSHHDPAVQDESNRNLFNRQKQLIAEPMAVQPVAQEVIDRIVASHPLPVDIANIASDLRFPEFVAVVIARLFMDIYNSMEGTGLFSGMERYGRLEMRMRMAAIVAPSLRAFWDRLCNMMQVPIHPSSYDTELLDMLSLPQAVQQGALQAIVEQYRSVVSVARLWHGITKLQSEEYAKSAGMMAMIQPMQVLHWDAAASGYARGRVVEEVPCVSANSLRHQVVREPAMLHLLGRLELAASYPGYGPLPASVEALFANGGNIAAGAKRPSNANALANQVRAIYPPLDLLGGVTDAFDIGESRLKVAGWLVCRENRRALEGSAAADLPNASISVFDMLDDVTMTRQASPQGLGQMIASFETLCAGVQVVCRLSLDPFTALLTRGCLGAAVHWFLQNAGTIGGQAARGYGNCVGEWLSGPVDEEAIVAYEAYLEGERERLVEGLVTGTLNTGVRILS